jgi:hypothetical protein
MGDIVSSQSYLQGFADSAINRAQVLANRIGSFSPGSTNVDFNYTPTKPNIQPPPSIGDLLATDTSGAAKAFLDGETEKWLAKFFPNLTSALRNQPEAWADGILSGSAPFGLPNEVHEAVVHAGRDRAYRAADSEKAQIRTGYSMRGFATPPGAAIAAMNNADIRAGDAIAEVNRGQMIRDGDIKIELSKFAAELAAQLKTGMLQVLANFYSQWADVLKQNTDIARAKAQAYAALTSGLSSYYNVELGFEELRLKAAAGKADAQEAAIKVRMQEGEVRAAQNRALAQAADAFARASSAAANAQSSLQAELYTGTASS